MFVIGLILIVLGAIAIVAALTASDGTVTFVGLDDLTAATVFFIGLGAGVAIWWGIALIRFGAKRSMKHRREKKKLSELSQQLDQVDRDRRHDNDNEDRPTL